MFTSGLGVYSACSHLQIFTLFKRAQGCQRSSQPQRRNLGIRSPIPQTPSSKSCFSESFVESLIFLLLCCYCCQRFDFSCSSCCYRRCCCDTDYCHYDHECECQHYQDCFLWHYRFNLCARYGHKTVKPTPSSLKPGFSGGGDVGFESRGTAAGGVLNTLLVRKASSSFVWVWVPSRDLQVLCVSGYFSRGVSE